MALPASGAISMSQVATELGISSTGINLNLASVRGLAGKASGQIAMSDLWGKSSNTVTSYVAIVHYGWDPTPRVYSEWTMDIVFSDGSRIGSASSTAPWMAFSRRGTVMWMTCNASSTVRTADVTFVSTTGLRATYRFSDEIGWDSQEEEEGSYTRRIYPTKIG